MNGIERRLQRIEEAAAQRGRGRVEAGRIDLKGFTCLCAYFLIAYNALQHVNL